MTNFYVVVFEQITLNDTTAQKGRILYTEVVNIPESSWLLSQHTGFLFARIKPRFKSHGRLCDTQMCETKLLVIQFLLGKKMQDGNKDCFTNLSRVHKSNK